MCARGMCVYTAACCRGALPARGLARFWLVLCLGLLLPVRRSSCILNATNRRLALMRSALLSCPDTCATRSLRPIHLILNTLLISYMSGSLALDIGTWNALDTANPFAGNGASSPNCRKEAKYSTPRFLDEHSLLLRHGIRLPADEPNPAAAAA
ncbi:hypothetical protein IWX50DRAFT_235736 [Phyllosticta citricarpa]